MSTDQHQIEPRPTDEEAAAIVAALAFLRQQATFADAETTPPPFRWREAGRREALRDESVIG